MLNGECQNFDSTAKLGDKELFGHCKIFMKARLFTIYEVNWQIGHSKWFNITKLFTI